MYAEDAFSRRAAETIEHLGAMRLAREAGVTAVASDDLLVREGDEEQHKAIRWAAGRLARGIEAYENLEPVEAVAHLQAAVDQFELLPGMLTGRSKADYLSALSYLGSSLILKGEPQQGQATFRKLLVFERRTRLDKNIFPPGMIRMFESARQEVTQGPTGTLSVFSSPEHCKVYVDGIFRGVTPCTMDRLPVGQHLVKVRKAGFMPWGKAVTIEAVEEKPVNCRLRDLPAGSELLRAVELAARELPDKLEPRLQALALGMNLERIAVGRLSQQGEGVLYVVTLFDAGSGGVIRSHRGVASPASAGFAKAVDAMFSYLITGRADVLQSLSIEVVKNEPLRLRDEELFDEPDVPFYERWYFWTAVGVGVVAAVGIGLGLGLRSEGEPGSQILLEF